MDEKNNAQAPADLGAEQEREGLHITREQFLNSLRERRELRKQFEGTGRFVLLPTEALTLRAESYFNQYKGEIASLLTGSGFNELTVKQVLQDYAGVLAGEYNVKLPLQRQKDVVNTVKPWRLLVVERYGLFLLFYIYLYNVKETANYISKFKRAEGTIENVTKYKDGSEKRETVNIGVEAQREQFIDRTNAILESGFAVMFAETYFWISRNEVEVEDGFFIPLMEPADFIGIKPEKVNKFLSYIEYNSAIDVYINYYYVAKYGLQATPEELREIEIPNGFKSQDEAQEFAEHIGELRYKNTQRRAAEVQKLVEAETVEELKDAQKELTENEGVEPTETIRIPETIAALCSRDVYASTQGSNIVEKGVIPISRVIEIYGEGHPLPKNITPYVIEKAIQGLNMLHRFNHDAPVNGYFVHETNITEFSRLCDYKNANAEEKAALLTALLVLHNVYVIVWKPRGRVAINLLNVPEIAVSGEVKGNFKLMINTEAFKGHQNYIDMGQLERMRKKAKGQTQAHFNAQLIAKGSKEENALLNEVFGYDTMILEATEYTGDENVNPEAVRNVKEYIRKHKNRDKKNLARWFEQYKQEGILEYYTYTKNKRNEFIYSWRRARIPQIPQGE